jgi:2-succinyl-6-hydroxy-2,4-cyclohexadiene-1-carboxylate synthase
VTLAPGYGVRSVVVLLHGFTQTSRSWDAVRAQLPDGLPVRAPDLRGHGAAGSERPVTLPAVVGDLDALIPQGAVLAGYSMGGRIALHFALAHPGRLARLVLIGASPGLADPKERAERRAADEALADRIEANPIEVFVEEWGRLALFAGQTPAVAAAARADRLRNTPAGLAAALRGLGTGRLEPLWERLGEAAMPVDLVVGERDAKFRQIAEAMLAGLPDGRLEVVDGAGHAVALERPGAIAQFLEAGIR